MIHLRLNDWERNIYSAGVMVSQQYESLGKRRQSNENRQTALVNGQDGRQLTKENKTLVLM